MQLSSYSRDFVSRCLTEQNAYGTLTRLCDEIGERPAGSAAERRANEMIAGLMSEYGLDASIEEFSYDGWERGPTTVSLASGGRRREIPAYPLGFSPPADLTAPVVDAGAGSEAEFRAADVAGRIALVSSATAPNTPALHRTRKYELAVESGAAGFVFYLDKPGGLTVMGSARLDATGCGPIPAVGITYEDAMATRRLTDAEMTIVAQCRGVDAVSTNAIGVREGRTDDEIIVCGHIDSWFSPGAVDNGSGVAMVVELARLLQPYDLQRRVRFITFGSEEIGILGSRAYVRAHPDLSPVKLVMNLDVPAIRDGRPTVWTNETPELHAFFAALARRLNLGLILHPEHSLHSDHARFRERGIPAVQFLTSGSEYGYAHTAFDTLDKITPEAFTIPMVVAGTAILECAMRDDLVFHVPGG